MGLREYNILFGIYWREQMDSNLLFLKISSLLGKSYKSKLNIQPREGKKTKEEGLETWSIQQVWCGTH